MSWSKIDIINKAFAEIGLGGYVFTASAEERQDALSSLDAMLARWQRRGIDTGYIVANDPSADVITGDSGIAPEYTRAVILNLATDIAPSFGKQVLPHTQAAAVAGYNDALSFSSVVPQMALDISATPAGAGRKYYRQTTITTPNPNPEQPLYQGPKFSIKRGDTLPVLLHTITPLTDLTGASATFTMRGKAGTMAINSAGATIASAANGTLQYDFTAANTAIAGDYIGEFEVTFADSSVQTFPSADYINISIVENLND